MKVTVDTGTKTYVFEPGAANGAMPNNLTLWDFELLKLTFQFILLRQLDRRPKEGESS